MSTNHVLNESAARINQVNCKLEDLSCEIFKDKVNVEGSVVKQVSYVEESSGSNTEESVKDSFSHSIEIPGARPGMEVKIYPRVEKVANTINPQEREKIDQATYLNLFIRVKEGIEVRAISDVEDMQMPSEIINLYEVAGEITDDLSMLKEIEFDEPVGRIISIPETNLTDVRAVIYEDTVKVTGTLESKIVYINDLSGNVERSVCEEPFEHKMNIFGIKEGMLAYVYPRVDHVSLEMMENKSVKQSALLKVFARVVEVRKQEIISKEKREEATKEEGKASGATIVIYVVQKEDSIYNIAQKYNVSIDSIIKANQIEDPDLIYSGQKILIPYCRIEA